MASIEAERQSTSWGVVTALLLWLVAAGELARAAMRRPWPGFPPWAADGVAVILAVLWSAAGIVLLLRRRGPAFAKAAWMLSVASPLAMIVHALVTRFGGSWWGLLYFPAALLAVFALVRTWGSGEFTRLRARVRAEAPPTIEDASGGMHSVNKARER